MTVLPYKLTKGGDGDWTTADGGWTLYGRTSVDVSLPPAYLTRH